MATWNFAALVDEIAREVPDREAVVDGARRVTWGAFASRARKLAWYLHTDAGLTRGDKALVALPNSTEYLESFVAVRKLGAVPLGADVAMSVDVLHKAIDASDAKVVVCSTPTVQRVRDASRRIQKRWRPLIVEVGPQYERGIATAGPPVDWFIEQPTADDLIFLSHRAAAPESSYLRTVLPAAPFALGSGLTTALRVLSGRGRVVFTGSAAFDPNLVWLTVDSAQVDTVTIAGDAFARPLLASLQAAPSGPRPTSLRTIASSGAPLSPDIAHALELALGSVTIEDTYEADETRAPAPAAKIDPSEVESRLLKHKSVADCAVLGVADPRIGKVVVAIVQVTDGHFLDAPELAAWCRARLPSTLTPGAFLIVDVIDRLPTGAADLEALRRLAVERLLDTT